GHEGDEAGARQLLADPAAAVRESALGALARLGAVTAGDVARALADPDRSVRRRACQVAAPLAGVDLRPALADADPSVVEVAAWALGERGAGSIGAVDDLGRLATTHPDPLCREAAVAALGAIG